MKKPQVQSQDKTYAELVAELQTVLEWFQAGDVSVEQATGQYEAGLRIIAELEQRLAAAESEIQAVAQHASEA